MVNKPYVPDSGDVVWLNLNPTLGREQKNRRPVLVLSPKSYNQKSSLVVACPITTKIKGYPFEVQIINEGVDNVVLSDQVRALDWRERDIDFYFRAPTAVLHEVQAKLATLLF